ncbi:cupin domain-containing protein [Streptomyces beijiangensis]|uniref:Cupin domain-containing protein n=1 Tax=Streptomyces beijiangensis TaxID=163361 RepID=A0A939FDC6_9ACTN|nr:cupin domain-containing protein [Streptomyces beijiangensis]MBO0516039.1 cupin domain-containing protein [Streptomyces beijiangensis]
MSLIVPNPDSPAPFGDSVIVRSADAEVIGQAPTTIRLLADASSTAGALSTQRVTLANGADGAKPHHHSNSAELFYVLDGTAQLLSGEQVVTAERGDLVIVPPGLPHAFAAAEGEDADILIVITPGVERFEYFRHLERIAYGKVPPESLLDVQELYDTYFLSSAPWDAARS